LGCTGNKHIVLGIIKIIFIIQKLTFDVKATLINYIKADNVEKGDILSVKTVKRVRSIRGSALVHIIVL